VISASVLTGADLQFDASTHIYRRPDGVVVPSVTQVLRAVGVSTDFDALKGMSERLGLAIDSARDLGVAVHADAHAFDDDDLDWDTVDARVSPYIEAWSCFRENTQLTPITRERRLYHPGLCVSGTLDAILIRPCDTTRRILVDIKTGDPDSVGARYQTAGYQLLWDAEHPDEPIAERWSVELTPERTVPYRITRYDDWTDAGSFRAFVTTYHCQAARRKAR